MLRDGEKHMLSSKRKKKKGEEEGEEEREEKEVQHNPEMFQTPLEIHW